MRDDSFYIMRDEIKYLMNKAEDKYRRLLDESEDTRLPRWIEVLLQHPKALSKKTEKVPYILEKVYGGDVSWDCFDDEDGINDLVMAFISLMVIAQSRGIYLPYHINRKIEKMQKRLML